MELKVKTPTFPEIIEFNFDELRKEITEKSSQYLNLVYTDEQISEAKKDRASLNKFVKALSDERIKIKKECLKPYEDFEKKINELSCIVNGSIKNIDGQVKAFDEKKKSEKLEKIKEYWNQKEKPFEVDFERIMDAKWLNSSVTIKSVQSDIDSRLEQIEKDIAMLRLLPEFAFEAERVYKSSLDVNKAVNEAVRMSEMAKAKAAYEAEKAEKERIKAEAETKAHEEQVTGQISFTDEESFEKCMNPPVKEVAEPVAKAPEREWIGFKAYLTVEDAQALANLFAVRGIEYAPIEI